MPIFLILQMLLMYSSTIEIKDNSFIDFITCQIKKNMNGEQSDKSGQFRLCHFDKVIFFRDKMRQIIYAPFKVCGRNVDRYFRGYYSKAFTITNLHILNTL